MLDDAAVGGRDDEDRERGRGSKEDGEIGVLAQVLECFFGAVCRRGEAVRAQADPGQKSDQRDVPEQVRVLQVLRAAEEKTLQALPGSRAVFRFRRHGLCGRAHREGAKQGMHHVPCRAASRPCGPFSAAGIARCNRAPCPSLHFASMGRDAPERGVSGTTSARGGRVTCFLGALFAGMMEWTLGREPDRHAGALLRPGEPH